MSTGRTLKTTETSISVLESIKRERGASLSDIADEFDMAPSTAHAYLNTLENEGLIVKTAGGEYCIGLRFLDFAQQAKDRDNGFPVAQTVVRELADDTKKEVDFHVEENGRLILIERAPAGTIPHPVPHTTYMYLHNTAAGKAILADLPRERVNEIIDRWGLPRETDRTITEKDALLDELDDIHRRGYSINREESLVGYFGVGAVVNKPDGRTFGALTIGGPTYAVTDGSLTEELPDVLFEYVERFEGQLEKKLG